MPPLRACLILGCLLFSVAIVPTVSCGQTAQTSGGTRRASQIEQDRLAERCRLVTSQLKPLFPNAVIRVFPDEDRVIVEGLATNTVDVERILTIVKCSIAPSIPQIEIVEDAGRWIEANVVNRITVQRHQVKLHVTVYHLDGKELEDSGLSMVDLLKVAGDSRLMDRAEDTGWLIGLFDKEAVTRVIRRYDEIPGLNALLAPELTVASGHMASFLSGGEVAVPGIVQTGGVEQDGNSTTTFKAFGTSLLIRPDVVDEGMIRLDVTLDLSRLCPHTINDIPHVDSHRQRTVANMKPGQVVAIAGIDARLAEGEPDRGVIRTVAGKLASKVRGGKQESADELLVLILPEIVQPANN